MSDIKIYKHEEQWDGFKLIHFNVFNINLNETIGRFTIQIMDDIVQLQGLYLKPEYRKKGLGDILLKRAKDEFYKMEGIKDELYIKVNKEYNKLIAWYEKNMFEYHSEAQSELNSGTQYDYIWMVYRKVEPGEYKIIKR